MVSCLVILTDLYTRRAGLSASAEILVVFTITSARSIAGRANFTCGSCVAAVQQQHHLVVTDGCTFKVQPPHRSASTSRQSNNKHTHTYIEHRGFSDSKSVKNTTKLSCRRQTARRMCKYNTPLPILVTMPNLVVKRCGHKYRRTPKIGEHWNFTLLVVAVVVVRTACTRRHNYKVTMRRRLGCP